MSNSNSFLCFMVGALAGAVAGVLLAPDSGSNTRAKIREAATDFARTRYGGGKEKIRRSIEEE